MNGAVKTAFILFVAAGISAVGADDDFFEKSEIKKSSFEKRLYYSLERTDGLTQQQKEAINQALKDFMAKKERQMALNIKKFQSDDIQKVARSLAGDDSDCGIRARESLILSIHKVLNPKQREQFIKKFQGMID